MLSRLEKKLSLERAIMLTIFVAALGYFVDVFDLLLFSIVRVQSLKSLHVPDANILSDGIFLINVQMAGLLIGGIVWGIWGDKLGRVSVLFGSILLYSIANIFNAFVNNVELYALMRFLAGLGLAGELGAGVTLASELLPREWRGLGTMFIASIGVAGAVFAAVIAEVLDWRMAYIIGGVMGLALLVLRLQVRESSMFEMMSKGNKRLKRGDIRMLLRPKSFKKYIAVILIGAPLWAVVGLFITFTPEFAEAFGMAQIPTAGAAVLIFYLALVIGDMFSGILSQILRSRRKTVMIFLGLTGAFTALYVLAPHPNLQTYYGLCFLLGVSCGYWAMFVQLGAEQFGTNIRATAATTVPNMVRGSTIFSTASFHALIPFLGVVMSGVTVVGVLLIVGFIAALSLKETFDADLDYLER